MKQFVIRVLNQHFRPVGPIAISLFPSDEFDENEKVILQLFCERIVDGGYDFIPELKRDPKFRDTLDLAAGYGHFVSSEAGPWYLGVFIAAECAMKPYANDSFSEQMFRSSFFADAPASLKTEAIWLMLLAFFCDRLDTSAERVRLYVEECAEAGYPLDSLLIDPFCSVRNL